MKRYFIAIIIVCLSTALFSQEQLFIDTAKNLYDIAKIYLNESKPDKITILYNAYLVVSEKIIDKSKIQAYSDFFSSVAKKNPDVFKGLWITIDGVPQVITSIGGWNHYEIGDLLALEGIPKKNPKSGWNHDEIQQIYGLINSGISPESIYINKLGPLNAIKPEMLQQTLSGTSNGF